MNALRMVCKNKSMTSATKNTANSRSWITASTDSMVGKEVSVATVNLSASLLYLASKSLNLALVALATSTALASDCFLMRKPIPLTPFKREIVIWSSEASTTSATSRKRIALVPLAIRTKSWRSSRFLYLPVKRTVICSLLLLILPVGKSRFESAMAWLIWAIDKPILRILSLSTLTRKERRSPPITCTSATPFTCLMAGKSWSSMRRMSSASDKFSATALSCKTGVAFGSILATIGFWASSGNLLRLLLILRCASSKASSMLADALNSSKTNEALSKEKEVTSSTFSIPESTSSNGLETWLSTVDGEAPG